jgi:hypothetical protein
MQFPVTWNANPIANLLMTMSQPWVENHEAEEL